MMRYVVLGLFLLPFLLFSSCKQEPEIEAAYALIERVTPGYGDQYQLELIPAAGEEDVYEIEAVEGKVVLRGNNTVSLATAFNQYLKYCCNAHVSWFGNQLDLPAQLPLPEKKIRNTINGTGKIFKET